MASGKEAVMPPKDIEKLLGGYATDTLTEQERRTSLQRPFATRRFSTRWPIEHALKEVLDDPRARRQLIEALKKKTTQRYWLENFLALAPEAFLMGACGKCGSGLLAITL